MRTPVPGGEGGGRREGEGGGSGYHNGAENHKVLREVPHSPVGKAVPCNEELLIPRAMPSSETLL